MKVVGAFFSIITLGGFMIWVLTYMANPSPENLAEVGPIIAQAAIPWWISVIEFLTKFGTVGAIGILVLLFFIAKNRG
jgi:hypothetical protein